MGKVLQTAGRTKYNMNRCDKGRWTSSMEIGDSHSGSKKKTIEYDYAYGHSLFPSHNLPAKLSVFVFGTNLGSILPPPAGWFPDRNGNQSRRWAKFWSDWNVQIFGTAPLYPLLKTLLYLWADTGIRTFFCYLSKKTDSKPTNKPKYHRRLHKVKFFRTNIVDR